MNLKGKWESLGHTENNSFNFPFLTHIRSWLLFLLISFAAFSAWGSNLNFVGNGSYSISGNTVVLQADELDNDDFFGTSGTIRLELWAFSSPYSGSGTGYKLASYSLGQLSAGYYFYNINSGSITFSLPPPGTWYLSLQAREYTASGSDGYTTRDWINFSSERVAGGAFYGDEQIVGSTSWQTIGSTVNMQIQQVLSLCDLGTSGSLRLDLWATDTPYAGGTIVGYRFGSYSLNPLTGGYAYNNINQNVAYTAPPDGLYYVTLTLSEYNSGNYVMVDYLNYSGLKTFGNPVPAVPEASAAIGISSSGFVANWNSVSGATGYRLDVSANSSFTSFVTGYQNLDVGNVTSRSLSGLTPNTTYYYRVRAYNSGGISGSSGTIAAYTIVPHGLTIIPIFDSSITSDPQSATIEATINSAIAIYQTNFTDPVIVCIRFVKDPTTDLGRSLTYYSSFSYQAYRAALVSHATTDDDAAALAHLPNTVSNPVNGDQNVYLFRPLARALGFSADAPLGETDSTISLNTPVMNLSPAFTDPSKYSLFSVVCHEIDEALGFNSALNDSYNGDPSPSGSVAPEDLFRYDQNGARSFTPSLRAVSYFSLDGITALARFNQDDTGDFQDWYSPGGQSPQVQDAFSTAGANPVLGAELRVLDVIGYTKPGPVCNYTLTTIPSPFAWGLAFGSGTTNCGASVTVRAVANPGFGFLNWTENDAVVSEAASYTFAGTTDRTLVANFRDIQSPTISISSPTSGQRLSNSMVSVMGTANDNVGLASVWYQFNGGEWSSAAGTSSWFALVNPQPGTNFFRAYCVDGAGNLSTTNSLPFNYVASAPFSVQLNGLGNIKPNYSGQNLVFGSTYKISAKPIKGFKFVGWTGSLTSSSPKITFMMTSNFTLTANFVDVARPLLVVTYPAAKSTLTNSIITVTGRASDNLAVSSVFYQFNTNGWALAEGTTNWMSAELNLTAPANIIRAFAVDSTGNVSRTNSITFQH